MDENKSITAIDGNQTVSAGDAAATPAKPAAPVIDAEAEKAKRHEAAMAELARREQGEDPRTMAEIVEGESKKDGPGDDAEDDKPEPKAEKPKAKADEKKGDDADDRRKVAKAEHALMRDGYTREEIKDLPIDSLLRLGARAAEKHRERDRQYQLARRSAQPSAKPNRTESDAETEDGDVHPNPKGSDAQSRANPADTDGDLESLLRELDEESAGTVRAGRDDAEKRVKAAEERAATALKANLRDFVESTRLRLLSNYPDLSGDDGHAAVLKEMDGIDPESVRLAAFLRGDPGARESLAHLYESAARVVYGEKVKETARRHRADRISEALDGQPEASVRRTKDNAAISKEARHKAAIEAIEQSGGDTERAKALFRRKTGQAVG